MRCCAAAPLYIRYTMRVAVRAVHSTGGASVVWRAARASKGRGKGHRGIATPTVARAVLPLLTLHTCWPARVGAPLPLAFQAPWIRYCRACHGVAVRRSLVAGAAVVGLWLAEAQRSSPCWMRAVGGDATTGVGEVTATGRQATPAGIATRANPNQSMDRRPQHIP